MLPQFIEMLQCVHDSFAPLELILFKKTNTAVTGQGNIEEGILTCPKCHRWYPIIDSIPRIMPDALRELREDDFLNRNIELVPQQIAKTILRVSNLIRYESKEETIKKHEISQRDVEASKYHQFCTPYTLSLIHI